MPSLKQHILDRRLQFRRIVRPVAINFEAVHADSAFVVGAPLVQDSVRRAHLVVGSAVDDLRRLAGRRGDAGHIAGTGTGAVEVARHLDAEVDRHDFRRFVMIEEDVVSISPEAGILPQEGPHLIQGWLEFLRDATHRHALAHRCENSWPNSFDGDDVCHAVFSRGL